MPKRILVVDDANYVGDFFRKAMAREGHEIAGVAVDGEEAVSMYFGLKPDLTIMDINLPKMDGVEAVKRIFARDPAARILVVTALSQKLLDEELMNLGVKMVLPKPMRKKEIVEAVNRFLAELS